MFQEKIENEDILEFYLDGILNDLSNKWHLYRGLIDTPCSLVVLNDKRFLFLSSTSICDKEHRVLLSANDWGLKIAYPIDKIQAAVKEYLEEFHSHV